MSDSDEIAEEARRLTREQAVTAKRFLDVLKHGYYPDVDPVRVPAAERDLLLPALRAMASRSNGEFRLNAAEVLVTFNERLGWEALIECLQSGDLALRRGALLRLTRVGIHDRLDAPNPPIGVGELLAALESSLADRDQWNRTQAVRLIGYLRTPSAFDRVVALLNDDRPEIRAEAAVVLGNAGYDRGALEVLDEMLRVQRHPESYFLVGALEHLCKSTDGDIRTRAAAVAARFIRRNLVDHAYSAEEANLLANDVWHCMDGIAAVCRAEQRDVLYDNLRQIYREILDSKLEWWVRGMALKRLAQLEGEGGIERLIRALSNPGLHKDAIEGLSSLAAGSNDPIVLEALVKEILRGSATQVSAAVKAFLTVGGSVKALAQDVLDRLEPGLAATVRWLLNDIGPREAATKLRPAYGDVETSEAKLQELDAKWQTKPDATQVVWDLLFEWNRLAGTAYKVGHTPVDHDDTVRDLTAICGEQFAVDQAVQTIEPNGDFRILLIHQGKGYSFSVKDHGRWCDVRAVIDALNNILADLGLAERFIELDCDTGDIALVTFARADIFMPVARELGIQLAQAQ